MVDGVLITTIVIDYSVSTVGMVGEEERERERKRIFGFIIPERRKRKMLKLDREK